MSGLLGKRILVTRPEKQASALSEPLRALGAEVIELPLLRICPPDSWRDFDLALSRIELYKWLVFASSNAAEASFERAKATGALSAFKKIKIASVGKGAKDYLLKYGLETELCPPEAVAESLLLLFPRADLSDESFTPQSNLVLWPRTNIGRDTLKIGLENLGWIVEVVDCYKTAGPADKAATSSELLRLLRQRRLDFITLTSSQAVRVLFDLLADAVSESNLSSLLSEAKLAVIGPQTAKTCLEKFGRVDIEAAEYSVDGLVLALSSFQF